MNKEVIYFELNNWFCGEHYPDDEPFITWMKMCSIHYFDNKDWVRQNKLCVVRGIVDQSVNFCITATKEWVEQNCPKLLTEYRHFLRKREEDDEYVYGYFGDQFLEYCEENIGIVYAEEDW